MQTLTSAPVRKATPRPSRSAVAYTARYMRSMPLHRRAQLQREWLDPNFNAGNTFSV